MRGESGVAGEGKLVGALKFIPGVSAINEYQLRWDVQVGHSNASSGLCIILFDYIMQIL